MVQDQDVGNKAYSIGIRTFLPIDRVNLVETDSTRIELDRYESVIDREWEKKKKKNPRIFPGPLWRLEHLNFMEGYGMMSVKAAVSPTNYKVHAGLQNRLDVPVECRANPYSINLFGEHDGIFYAGVRGGASDQQDQIHTVGAGFIRRMEGQPPEQLWQTAVREFLEESVVDGIELEALVDGEVLKNRKHVAKAVVDEKEFAKKLDRKQLRGLERIRKKVYSDVIDRGSMRVLAFPYAPYNGDTTTTIYAKLKSSIDSASKEEYKDTLEIGWDDMPEIARTGRFNNTPLTGHAVAGYLLLSENEEKLKKMR